MINTYIFSFIYNFKVTKLQNYIYKEKKFKRTTTTKSKHIVCKEDK